MTTAAPCTNCRTCEGAWDRVSGERWRKNGLCAACYQSQMLHDETRRPSIRPQTLAERVEAQVYPCLDCGTTGGRIGSGESRPTRSRGLCLSCYEHHRNAGTIGRYATSRHVVIRRVTGCKLPADQRRDRIALIAMRVARHESVGATEAEPQIEGAWDTASAIASAERCASAWLETHLRHDAA